MLKVILSSILFLALISCETVVKEESQESSPSYTNHSEWSKNAVIYELNIRQFSDKGDFNSIIPELDRLKNMGIDIIWLMPVHPIGEENRKGGLGSYYSVKDYVKVNPNYGSIDDFKRLVLEIHKRDMFVLIDWVANHTSWDNPWISEHPDWYTKDSLGEMIPPIGTDWSDVVDLNYENAEMRKGMINSLKFWITECDIDGFRCDVADWVPVDFWEEARQALDSVKPDLFMLAEAENPKHHNKAFDMSYAWEFHGMSNEIAKGEKNLEDIKNYMIKEDTNFVSNAYRMYFTSNHDENSWNGTVLERYGDNYKNWALVMSTIDGMPLIYSGQESKMNERLKFFEKDTIQWSDYELQDFYKTLFDLKDANPAIWNGEFGGSFKMYSTVPENDSILVYARVKNENSVLAIINFGSSSQIVKIPEIVDAEYSGVFGKEKMNITDSSDFEIKGNGFLLFQK
jgi:glycosidase